MPEFGGFQPFMLVFGQNPAEDPLKRFGNVRWIDGFRTDDGPSVFGLPGEKIERESASNKPINAPKIINYCL